MATPPMLRSSPGSGRGSSTPDPLVALNVFGLAVVGLGLFIAGLLAVYDWKTPGAEGPLVFWLVVTGLALFAIDVAVLAVRHVRRLRLGL